MKIKYPILITVLCYLFVNCNTKSKEQRVQEEVNVLIEQGLDSVTYDLIKDKVEIKSGIEMVENVQFFELQNASISAILEYEKSLISKWDSLPEYQNLKPTFELDSIITEGDSIFLSRCSTKDKAPFNALRTPSASNQRISNFFLFEYSSIQIPVNVHIVNNNKGYMLDDPSKPNPKIGIKKEQIDAQFKILNDTFNKHNIFFTLNSIDSVSNSRWNESGTYYYSPSTLDAMLRHFANTPDTHLNLYIIDGRKTGRFILGEASFPWDVTSGRYNDYVVISARTIPGLLENKADEGKTLIHEIGHYLGLWHTFEGGPHDDGCYYGDRVDDTPFQKIAHNGPCKCSGQQCDTCTGLGYEGKDPTNNYMGYNDDNCMSTLTEGQIDRIFKSTAFHRGNFFITTPLNL